MVKKVLKLSLSTMVENFPAKMIVGDYYGIYHLSARDISLAFQLVTISPHFSFPEVNSFFCCKGLIVISRVQQRVDK